MELRSIMSMCNVFRHFVPNLVPVATLLNQKICISQLKTFDRISKNEITFLKALKARLVALYWRLHVHKASSPLTQIHSLSILDVFFCNKQPNGTTRFGYESQAPNNDEQAHDSTDQKCLAVVCAVLLLHLHLDGRRFTFRADHYKQKMDLNFSKSTCKPACCLLLLCKFKFDFVHRMNISLQMITALSRLKRAGPNHKPLQKHIPVMGITAFILIVKKNRSLNICSITT